MQYGTGSSQFGEIDIKQEVFIYQIKHVVA